VFLELDAINTYYGSSHILFDVSLGIEKGEAVALMGRNGAGKTTTLRSIISLTPPKTGHIRFKGEEIAGKSPYKIARKGIGFVPEDRRIFAGLSVRENLEIAQLIQSGPKRDWDIGTVFHLFPKLKDLESRSGGTLSGGEQQMLTIARALLSNPELLLLDEPFEGLAPLIVKHLSELMLQVKTRGITVLITEQQHLKYILDLADRVYILDKGHIQYHGGISELWQNEEFKRKYLAV
jgi:branched-chain amino acid transport system ATP-binding protein